MSRGTGHLSVTSLVQKLRTHSRISHRSQQTLEGVCMYSAVQTHDSLINLACMSPGRAWLYMALNEQAMESYVRMFLENQVVVQEHYLRLVWSVAGLLW